MLVKMNCANGGGVQLEEGNYTIDTSKDYEVIPLPFTPTRFYYENNNGTIGSCGYYDSNNNINVAVTRIQSNSVVSYDTMIVNGNQVSVSYNSSNFNGATRYWVAIKD